MSSDGAVWVRVPAEGVGRVEEEVKRVRSLGRGGPLRVLAFDPAQHAFALVDRWGRSDDIPGWAEEPDLASAVELAELSRTLSDVVALFEVDEGENLGIYGHWRDGALVRGLVFADGEWAEATGEPQVWEAPAFAAEHLERALQDARDDGGDEEAVRGLFARGRIEQGARLPRPSMGRHMRAALRAPGWGFAPWPRRRDVERELGA